MGRTDLREGVHNEGIHNEGSRNGGVGRNDEGVGRNEGSHEGVHNEGIHNDEGFRRQRRPRRIRGAALAGRATARGTDTFRR